jgi:ActR/RegA family two-component response regulator
MGQNKEFIQGIGRYQGIVIGSNRALTNPLRSALKSIGLKSVDIFPSLAEGSEASKRSSITHVLFSTSDESMHAVEFVREVIAANPKVILVVVTENPGMDNVFELIQSGARGFLVPPASLESVEAVLAAATSGPPISQTILQADDRNDAFAKLILDMLFRVAAARKELIKTGKGGQMYDRFYMGLQASTATAKMFCEGGFDSLQEKIVENCIKRADIKKTRLSEVRKNLRKGREA